jgi:hypothetical protein
MKKMATKRLPLHRETLSQLEAPELLWAVAASDGQGSRATCSHGPHSSGPTCPL